MNIKIGSIEDGVPLKPMRRESRFREQLTQIKVNQSFLVQCDVAGPAMKDVMSQVYELARRLKITVTIRKESETSFRVWRIEDDGRTKPNKPVCARHRKPRNNDGELETACELALDSFDGHEFTIKRLCRAVHGLTKSPYSKSAVVNRLRAAVERNRIVAVGRKGRCLLYRTVPQPQRRKEFVGVFAPTLGKHMENARDEMLSIAGR